MAGLRLLMVALLAVNTIAAFSAEHMTLLIGSEQSGQGEIGRDIAAQVGRPAAFDLTVVPGVGGAESLLRMRNSAGMRTALLTADIVSAYQDVAADPDVMQLLAPLRVIAPLHRETFFFIVRADSPWRTIRDIGAARISAGPLHSGSSLSFVALYRVLFDRTIDSDKLNYLRDEDALAKLITDQSVDVVVLLSAQPAKLLAGMTPEARKFIKLLRVDGADIDRASQTKLYEPSAISTAVYPNLLGEDLPALSVRLYWASYGYRRGTDDARMTRLARAWCQALPRLQAEGSSRWRDVTLGTPELPAGWSYARAARRELSRCLSAAGDSPADLCSNSQRMLGLCD